MYDDFAHHPTEIKASLKLLREENPGKKIICLFEIRSNSMIAGTHKSELIDAFLEADDFFLYCKKDINWLNPTENINFSTDLDKIIDEIKQSTEIVDIVILMSNGNTDNIIKKIKKK